MRIDFEKNPTYNQQRLFKHFAYLPKIVWRKKDLQSLIWLESYISLKEYRPSQDREFEIRMFGFFVGTLVNAILNLIPMLILHTFWGFLITTPIQIYIAIFMIGKKWKNPLKTTTEYSFELYKDKFPDFFNNQFTKKFNKLLNG